MLVYLGGRNDNWTGSSLSGEGQGGTLLTQKRGVVFTGSARLGLLSLGRGWRARSLTLDMAFL